MQEKTEEKKAVKPEEYIDESAEVVDPNECLTFIQAPEVKQIEIEYFSMV